MYTFYPIVSLKDWFTEHGELLNNTNLWSSPHLVLLYSRLVDQWLEREMVDVFGITMGTERSDHVENSVIYWAERILQMHDANPLPIAGEKHLFLALYRVNQEKGFLPAEAPHTIPYLRKLAKLFWLYDIDEVPFLSEWRENKISGKEDLQRLLWQEIFLEPNRNFLSFSEALDRLKDLPFSPENLPFSSLFYFSGYLSNPHVLKFLYLFWEKGFTVHHIAFTPSFHWGSGKFPSFLGSWASVYQETRIFLRNHPDILLASRTPKAKQTSLLGAIQSLFTGEGEITGIEITEKDPSFSLIQASGPLREIEILADKILETLQDSKVRAEEVSLALGDTKTYLPLVEAVFQDRGIPFTLMGKDPRAEHSSLLQALTELLAFPYSEFSLEELFSFLSNESVLKNLRRTPKDLENFQRFTRESGILYGWNEGHKRALGGGKRDSHTWEKGFERLYLGLASLTRNLVSSRPPLDFTFLEWANLSPFITATQNLWEDTSWISKTNLNLREWTLFTRALASRYLDMEHPDFASLGASLARLENLGGKLELNGKKLGEENLPFSLFQTLLTEDLSPNSNTQNKNSLGVRVGSLEALAPLPAHFAFLAGLGHENLTLNPRDPLNLHHKRLKELREILPNAEREQFLSLLLGTSDSFILSYSASEEKIDNLYSASRPPFVNDLLSFLKESPHTPYHWQWSKEPLNQIIQIHPSLASDSRYFEAGETVLTSLDKRAYEQANLINRWWGEEMTESAPLFTPERTEEIPVFRWGELKNFLEASPARYFEKTLNIPFPPLQNLSSAQNSLENFDPSERLWSRDFWSLIEVDGELKNTPVDSWIASLDYLITQKAEEDLLEERLYTQKNIKSWYLSLLTLHELLTPYFPLKREDWLLWSGQEPNSIGEWNLENWTLSGSPLYPTYCSGDDLFVIPPLEQKLFYSDFSSGKAIAILGACLYKSHPELKKRGLKFKTLHILKDSRDGWFTLSWDDLQEDWFDFLSRWIATAEETPLPLYPEVLEELVKKGKDDSTLPNYIAIIYDALEETGGGNPSPFHHSASPYFELWANKWGGVEMAQWIPEGFESFLGELRDFWQTLAGKEKK